MTELRTPLKPKKATQEDFKQELSSRIHSRSNFAVFVKYTKPDYHFNWHHILLCRILQEFQEGKIKKLMIFCPPQTGKSELSTRRLPAYILGKDGSKKVAVCAYNQTFSSSFNRDIQRIIIDQKYKNVFPLTTLNEKNVATTSQGSYLRNSEQFEIVGNRGGLKSVGIGSPLTGSPVDIGIIDDPIKDAMEAYSLTYRNRIWEWYETVFSTRLHNDSQQLITLTRWHEDDLAGRLIEREGNEWIVIKLAGIREDEYLPYDQRSIGEALWPSKHSLERYLTIQANSPRTWTSMYQQRPAPISGGIIKRDYFEIVDRLPTSSTATNCYIDTAYTEKQSNDPSAVLYCRTINNITYVVKYKEIRAEFSDLCDFLIDGHENYCSDTSKAYIEPKASGKSVVQYLKRHTRINVIEFKMVEGDKIARTNANQPIFESGRVKLLRGAWNNDFLEKLAMFPNAKHDEAVDCLNMAVEQELKRSKPPKRNVIYNHNNIYKRLATEVDWGVN